MLFIDCNRIEQSFHPTLRESGNSQLIYFNLQGEQIRIKNMKDLFLYTYVTDFQAWYVVENQVSVSVPFILQKYILFVSSTAIHFYNYFDRALSIVY